MKYMILVKATADSEAGKMPPESLLAEMGAYHEELAKAGVLVDGAGLKPSAKGWRVKYAKGGKRTFVDGPSTEAEETAATRRSRCASSSRSRTSARARQWSG